MDENNAPQQDQGQPAPTDNPGGDSAPVQGDGGMGGDTQAPVPPQEGDAPDAGAGEGGDKPAGQAW